MDKFIKILRNIQLPIVAIIILFIVLIFTRECGNRDCILPNGKILVNKSFMDSLQKIATTPPDTIIKTSYIKGDVVYVEKKVPVPVAVDTSINIYLDSLIRKDISVWAEITAKGIITKWDWRYQSTIIKDSVTITIYKPKPVKYEVSISKSGVYASLGVGGNESAFILSGELDLITSRDKLYGVQYMRFSEQNYYLFRLGTKIKFSK